MRTRGAISRFGVDGSESHKQPLPRARQGLRSIRAGYASGSAGFTNPRIGRGPSGARESGTCPASTRPRAPRNRESVHSCAMGTSCPAGGFGFGMMTICSPGRADTARQRKGGPRLTAGPTARRPRRTPDPRWPGGCGPGSPGRSSLGGAWGSGGRSPPRRPSCSCAYLVVCRSSACHPSSTIRPANSWGMTGLASITVVRQLLVNRSSRTSPQATILAGAGSRQ